MAEQFLAERDLALGRDVEGGHGAASRNITSPYGVSPLPKGDASSADALPQDRQSTSRALKSISSRRVPRSCANGWIAAADLVPAQLLEQGLKQGAG